MRNASDVPLPPFAGNTGPQPYVPPDEPCDPKNVTWSHMATFTYMHKCSEICDAWYGLLQRNGTYNGPLKNQNAPDGKYVLEPSISCQVCRSEPQRADSGMQHVDWLRDCMTCIVMEGREFEELLPLNQVVLGVRHTVTACRQGGYAIPETWVRVVSRATCATNR